MGVITKVVTEMAKPIENVAKKIITKEGRKLVPLTEYSGIPKLTEGEIWTIKRNDCRIKQLLEKAEDIRSDLQRGLFGDIKIKTEKELEKVLGNIEVLQDVNKQIRGIELNKFV